MLRFDIDVEFCLCMHNMAKVKVGLNNYKMYILCMVYNYEAMIKYQIEGTVQ
jgi:hypothetical protein